MANTEIQKSDIKDFLWFQNCIEEVLFNVTLQRAIEKGRYAPEQRWLYKERVTHCLNETDGPEIWVQYDALIGKGTFVEVYTIREALALCIFPKMKDRSFMVEEDEE
jgi:hypothetical protein